MTNDESIEVLREIRDQLAMQSDNWWSIRRVAQFFDVSTRQAWRIVNKPGFPAAHRPTGGDPRWKAAEVRQYDASRTGRPRSA